MAPRNCQANSLYSRSVALAITDGGTGSALVWPLKTGPGDTSTHQVYGLDAQRYPQWRNRMPITNVAQVARAEVKRRSLRRVARLSD